MVKKLRKVIKKSLPKVAEVEKISPLKKTKIRVIGIGGGGGNIVSELAERVKKTTFLAANTDLQALREVSRKVERFPFGQSFTQGLGTGMNPELAEIASQNEKERIKKILQGQDLVIFIACLGGGTGSGATPIFAKICQNLGNLSYGIFTLPFKFEGEKKMEIAKMALEKLRSKLNVITILPNERIFQVIDKTTPLKEAFSAINKSLAQNLEGLIETIYQPGLINIDFADLRTILSGWRGRLAYLNTISLPKKEGRVREAVEKALVSPLYSYSIKGAKGVLFNIAGERGLSLEEVSQISKTISEKANPEAKIIFGISAHSAKGGYPKDKNLIKTTIFASGLSATPCQKFWWGATEAPEKIRPRKIKRPAEKPSGEVRPLLKTKKVKSKKRKSKVSPKPEKKLTVQQPKAEMEKENPPRPAAKEIKVRKNALQFEKNYQPTTILLPSASPPTNRERVRKSALQIKREIEEEEKEIIEKEKFWEAPAFLRKRKII